MARSTRVSVLTLVAACCLTVYGCSGSNDSPTTGGGLGAGTPSAGAAAVAGSPATAGSPGAAGASAVAGASSGGASLGGASSGGAPSTAGAGGAPAAGGASGSYSPLCVGLKTAAMMEPAKGIACAAPTDPQLCYRTCGPQATGYKTETCTGGVYVEGSGCAFPPDLDATCFKLPATQDATCPTVTPPRASDPCAIATCTVCNLGGGATGTYLDSKGAQKIGYCVCQAPKGAATMGTWSCGSTDAWPCPSNLKGC